MKERFFRNRTAVFTVVFVLLVGLVGILAPVIAPNDPYETNLHPTACNIRWAPTSLAAVSFPA